MKAIALLGPTCVGKTSASILLAEHLSTEIIGADSMQIYKGMDVGTAKPDATERARVRHHMIDVVEPTCNYSAGEYLSRVSLIIEALTARGSTPLVVGGTGLYVRAMSSGLFSAPAADWQFRHRLASIEEKKSGMLYRYLRRIDPAAARKIHPSDVKKTVRAIEVYVKSGKPISLLQSTGTRPLPYEFIKIALYRDRQELYAMIERRVDEMLEGGLVGEAQRLYPLGLARTPMQAIGYKEVFAYIEGRCTLDESSASIKTATRHYAKRQFTWFNKERDLHWVDVTGVVDPCRIFERIISKLRDINLKY
ncbi:MAG: tRNA (adenosine(37)-N6)-dimethylallyltransferase MiaA [Nitrospirae bacterium]|nr:tRNA (adenosine(37)-N6)-dimethylallyltransferase MiaA [Nitrospirota bacterium]